MTEYLTEPRSRPLLVRGLITGLLGAAAVAAWFFLLDVIAARPFFTPAALGSALFFGAQSETEVSMSAGVIAGYTVLHAALFFGAGLLFVKVADYLEQRPQRVLLVLLTAILLEALLLATIAVYAEWILGALGIWAITVANGLAILVMAWQAWRTHPALRQQLPRTAPDI
jgi:hypothetical protein